MKMIPIEDKKTIRSFLDFPNQIHADNPAYIIPLEKDIEEIFNPQKNKFFKHGSCERWICINENNQTVGKIAAFINRKYKQNQPTGGIGFFDCIDDLQVSRFMFDHCKNWLQAQGMEAMDGPINFGERDKFWGLLIEGFSAPLYGMNYHPPYYESLFKDYGFEVYFHQMCFARKVSSPLSDHFSKAAKNAEKYPGLRLQAITKSNLGKSATDFTEVYNKAWASHGQGKQLDIKVAKKMFSSMKPVLNNHISFLVYEYDKPIGMWVNLPDLNQWFKHLKGKFSFWHKLKFLWIKNTRKNTQFVGLVFGIIPEWQKKGIDGFLIAKGAAHIKKNTDFESYEMQWIGDFNPKMISIAKNLETTLTRRLATYRYLFDRNIPFQRHPLLD